ncbi:MAG: hypothetical protein CMH57_02205 [Myxococcales bacterium]|nr:hypothetical protein [Myxococcales bacterium]
MRESNSNSKSLELPQPGDLVAGRYRILRQLGAGGFGVVYQARQESMRRDVAIKTLLPQISSDPVAIERFRREAFYSSGLRHPNTITIHDYGQTEEGLFYIVMELLEGESLARAIYRAGGLPLGRAMRIGVQVLRSLGEAHQQGLVHRDLKPENIFLTEILGEEDFVKVLDFGLSKALRTKDEDASLTQHGMVFGTPLYMSPEQAYGEEVTPAADVFAFGLLFYEMLLGQRPYSGANQMEVMMKITRDPMPRLPRRLQGTPVEAFLNRLTEKELDARFVSAVDALPTLERLSRGEGLEALGDLDRVYVGAGAPDFGAGGLELGSEEVQEVASQEEPAAPRSPRPRSAPRTSPSGAARRHPASRSTSDGPQLARPSSHPSSSSRRAARRASLHPSRLITRRPKATVEPQRANQPGDPQDATRPSVEAMQGSVSVGNEVTVDLEATRRARHHRRFRATEPATVIVSVDQVAGRPAEPDDVDATLADVDGLFGFTLQTPFIGRERELSYLVDWGSRVAAGEGGVVMVEGVAGVGKSRLVEEFCARVEPQGEVRLVRGSYIENSLGASTGLREALAELLGLSGLSDEDAAAVIQRQLEELDIGSVELVPMMMSVLRPRRRAQRESSTTFGVATPSVYRVLERLLFRESNRLPIVMVIEDLQWADPFTLGFTEHLATAPERRKARGVDTFSLPLLLICTLRRNALMANPELGRALQSIGRSLGLRFGRLELTRLSEDATRELAQCTGRLNLSGVQDLVRLSHGNPMYILQALRYLRLEEALGLGEHGGTWALPEDLFELIRRRVGLIAVRHEGGERCEEVLQLISVLGVSFSSRLIESYLVHLGRDDLVAQRSKLLSLLQLEGVLLVADDGYRFEHILVQEAMNQMMLEHSELGRYHEAAARAKESAGFDNDALMMGWLGGIAHHWAQAGDRARSLEFSLREARAAEESWDLRSARSLYRSVDEELRLKQAVNVMRIEVLYALGRLHSRFGELGPAEDTLRGAIEMSRQLEDARWEGKAQVVLGKVLIWQSRHREALRCFRRAMACFSGLSDTTSIDVAGLADAQLGQGEVARVRGDLTTAEATLAQALQKARQAHSPEVEAPCLQALGRIAYLAGRLGDSIGFLQGAAQQFESAGLVVEGTSAQSDLALVQLRVYGRHVALETVGRSLKTLGVAGDRLEAANARLHQSIVLRRGMDLNAATQSAQQAMTVFREFSHSYGVAKATLMLAELNLMRGDIEQAEVQGQESLQQHEAIGDAHGTALCLLFLGQCALEQGRDEEARSQLAHALDIVTKNGLSLYRAICNAYLGCVEEQRVNLDAAHAFYTEAYNLALQSGDQEQVAHASILLGGLAFIQGQIADARGMMETALSVANELDIAQHRVHAMFGLAWLDTINGQFNSRQELIEQLTPMVKPLNAPDFYLRERVARTARAVTVIHGASTAEHFRRAALDVIHNLR